MAVLQIIILIPVLDPLLGPFYHWQSPDLDDLQSDLKDESDAVV